MIPSAYTRFWDNFDWELYQRVVKAKFETEMEDLPKLIQLPKLIEEENQNPSNNNNLKNNNEKSN
jgi:hypothetical protein